MRRLPLWLGYALVVAFLGVFLIAPVATMLWSGLDAAHLVEVVRHPVYRAGLLNAVGIAVVTTTLALAIAVPLAFASARWRFPGKGLAEALVLVPLIMPPFVGALGLRQVFGTYGVLNALFGTQVDWLGEYRFVAVCLLEALHLYPVLYLSLVANLSRIDHRLLEAARSCGAGPWTRLWRITLPLLRPGLFAGGVIVFIWSLTELGTPLLLDYHRVTPVQIYAGLAAARTDAMPFALAVVLLALSALSYVGARWLVLGRGRGWEAGSKAGGSGARQRDLGPGGAAGAWALYLAVFLLAAMPHVAVGLIALTRDWYDSVLPSGATTAHLRAALAHPLVVPSIVNSLEYASLATALALVLGTFIAWTVIRWRPPGARALDLLATVPLAIPGIILAFGYVALVARIEALDRLLDPTANPTALLVIAYAVRRLPYITRAAASGLAQAPVLYEEAAQTCGAGWWLRLRRITLPLIATSLMAGALLTFSYSMLEVADSLVLAQKRAYYPVTKVIYELMGMLGTGPAIACAFALWAMVFLGLTMAATALLLGRRLALFFRR